MSVDQLGTGLQVPLRRLLPKRRCEDLSPIPRKSPPSEDLSPSGTSGTLKTCPQAPTKRYVPKRYVTEDLPQASVPVPKPPLVTEDLSRKPVTEDLSPSPPDDYARPFDRV